MYELFGDKFDLNHDGRLSAAEHMMDFSVFNYWATDDDDGGATAIVHRNRITTMIMILMIVTATITMMVSRAITKKMNYGNRLTKSESTLMKLSR